MDQRTPLIALKRHAFTLSSIAHYLLFTLAASLLSSVAWATDIACVSPEQTIAAALVGGTNGCTTTGYNFLDFEVANTGTATFFPAVTAFSAPTAEFSNAFSGSTTTLDFRTTGQSTGTGTCTASSWCEDANSATGTQSVNYEISPTGQVVNLGLTIGTLQTPTNIHTGDTVFVKEQFCLGSATVSGCTAADLGFLEIQDVTTTVSGATAWVTTTTVCTPGPATCTQTHPGSASINLFGQTVVGIEDTVSINDASNEGRPVFLDSFNNTIGDVSPTPEPGTLGLFSAAGIGLIFLRRRRPAGSGGRC